MINDTVMKRTINYSPYRKHVINNALVETKDSLRGQLSLISDHLHVENIDI